MVASLSGDYDTALAMANDVLDAGRRTSDPRLIGRAYQRIAYIACEAGLYDLALSACQEVRSYSPGTGDFDREAWSWIIEGRTQRRRRNPEAAVTALDAAVVHFEAVGDDEAIGLCRLEQGLALLDSDASDARALLSTAAELLHETTDAYTIIAVIEGVARLLFLEQQPEPAIELIGTGRHLREQTGISPSASDAAALQDAIDLARTTVDVTAFDRHIERGRARSPRAAIELYLISTGS
jgi:tetratricopeptide (TPR) repeat protein